MVSNTEGRTFHHPSIVFAFPDENSVCFDNAQCAMFSFVVLNPLGKGTVLTVPSSYKSLSAFTCSGARTARPARLAP